MSTQPQALGANCLDISNWQGAVVPAACWRETGITHAIVGCQYPQIALGHIKQLRDANIEPIALYQFNYWSGLNGGSPEDGTLGEMRKALDVGHETGISLIFADCESYKGETPTTVEHKQGLLDDVIALAEGEGAEVGIYTSPGWWRSQMDDTPIYGNRVLWRATYFFAGSVTYAAGFGGWQRCQIHQFTTTGSKNTSVDGGLSPSLCGVSVDYNVIHAGFWEHPQVKSAMEGAMRDPRVDSIMQALTGLGTDAAQIERLKRWNEYDDGTARGNSLLDGYIDARQAIAVAAQAIGVLQQLGDGRQRLDAEMAQALRLIAKGAEELAQSAEA